MSMCGWRGKCRWDRVLIVGAAACLAVSSSPAPAQQSDAPASKPKREPIYDEAADAKSQIAAALARAGRDNRRVLLMFGANWCGWCHKLHSVFKEDKEVAKTLQYEYELVLVDIGRRDKNVELAKSYGADLAKEGVPFLSVLDAEGKVLAGQETGSLEAGERHDPEKVLALLKRYAAQPLDARQVLDAALARAKSQGKMVFLHVGAPWCGWCRKLDAFLSRKEIAAILQRDFIEVNVELERMTNAKEVGMRFRKEDSGLPWFAFVDAEGRPRATSEGPGGNIGFPAAPEEIAHFADMLKKSQRSITPDDIKVIESALQQAAQAGK